MDFNSLLFEDAYDVFKNRCRDDIVAKLQEYRDQKETVMKYIEKVSRIMKNKCEKSVLTKYEFENMRNSISLHIIYVRIIDRFVDKYSDIICMMNV